MQQISTTSAWLFAVRTKTLTASMSPVVLGTAFALRENRCYLSTFLLTILFAIFIQIGTNLANDYFDFVKGADRETRIGPPRVCQKGWIAPEKIKTGFLVSFLLAALLSIPLILKGGIFIAFIMLLSILFGILYTGGPFPLGYLGLGDLFVLLFFGPIACVGSYFLQTEAFSFDVMFAGLGCGLVSCAILTVNNLRDADEDRFLGKKP